MDLSNLSNARVSRPLNTIRWEKEYRNTRVLFIIFMSKEKNEDCIGNLLVDREDEERIELGLSDLAKRTIGYDEERSPRKISS